MGHGTAQVYASIGLEFSRTVGGDNHHVVATNIREDLQRTRDVEELNRRRTRDDDTSRNRPCGLCHRNSPCFHGFQPAMPNQGITRDRLDVV